MILLRFSRFHGPAAMDSWSNARHKHPAGAVSDISFDGVKFSYTIKLP